MPLRGLGPCCVPRYLHLENSRATSKVLVHWASSVVREQDAGGRALKHFVVGGLLSLTGDGFAVQIQSHPGDDDLVADMIIHKLGNTPGIKFVEIAKVRVLFYFWGAACAVALPTSRCLGVSSSRQAATGRKPLAIKLLEQESRVREQIPVLLRQALPLSKGAPWAAGTDGRGVDLLGWSRTSGRWRRPCSLGTQT